MTIYRHAQYEVVICTLTYRLSSRQSPESRKELLLFHNVLRTTRFLFVRLLTTPNVVIITVDTCYCNLLEYTPCGPIPLSSVPRGFCYCYLSLSSRYQSSLYPIDKSRLDVSNRGQSYCWHTTLLVIEVYKPPSPYQGMNNDREPRGLVSAKYQLCHQNNKW